MKYETSLLAYQAALEGHGVALAQKTLIEKELSEKTLIALDAPVLNCGRHTYYFSWPRSRPAYDELIAFRDWLANVSNV
jgi:LysR family glycine cleavage system transcriptional activator